MRGLRPFPARPLKLLGANFQEGIPREHLRQLRDDSKFAREPMPVPYAERKPRQVAPLCTEADSCGLQTPQANLRDPLRDRLDKLDIVQQHGRTTGQDCEL